MLYFCFVGIHSYFSKSFKHNQILKSTLIINQINEHSCCQDNTMSRLLADSYVVTQLQYPIQMHYLQLFITNQWQIDNYTINIYSNHPLLLLTSRYSHFKYSLLFYKSYYLNIPFYHSSSFIIYSNLDKQCHQLILAFINSLSFVR
ncbi:unnamed protein product (macronuclear) [Paramecium tetraurelia]|uniref:Transmembrane protein n=1 Tax=Paramecium tetraurelia TaxID=5888 RepID=A0CHH1_PARTE|nr:uncharacterized protein GSPATT00038340001 [Paramecium tetraurelia]CAK70238.1 unnamed protein product [Paramecium tetraurelia]|eukprot:XP_001437635.1 hypothetical protein (macronuclear) [Paramecium tetraurelia strain d4-2]